MIMNKDQVMSLNNGNLKVSSKDTCGKIEYDEKKMQYNRKKCQMSLELQLKDITRHNKKGTELVTDEKFSIMFESTNCNVGEADITVWVKSKFCFIFN